MHVLDGGIKARGTNKLVGVAWNQLGGEGQEYFHAQAAESVRLSRLKKKKTDEPANGLEVTLARTSSVSNPPSPLPGNVDVDPDDPCNIISPSTSDPTTLGSIESDVQPSTNTITDLTAQAVIPSFTPRHARPRPLKEIEHTVESWLSDLLPQVGLV